MFSLYNKWQKPISKNKTIGTCSKSTELCIAAAHHGRCDSAAYINFFLYQAPNLYYLLFVLKFIYSSAIIKDHSEVPDFTEWLLYCDKADVIFIYHTLSNVLMYMYEL